MNCKLTWINHILHIIKMETNFSSQNLLAASKSVKEKANLINGHPKVEFTSNQ